MSLLLTIMKQVIKDNIFLLVHYNIYSVNKFSFLKILNIF